MPIVENIKPVEKGQAGKPFDFGLDHIFQSYFTESQDTLNAQKRQLLNATKLGRKMSAEAS